MIIINIDKAKETTHEIRRAERAKEFEPLDAAININIADTAKVAEVEGQRQAIRDKYAAVQVNIDNCGTADELKNIIKSMKAM